MYYDVINIKPNDAFSLVTCVCVPLFLEVVDVEAGGFVDEFREESADPLDTSQYEEGEELPHPAEPPDTSTLLTKVCSCTEVRIC